MRCPLLCAQPVDCCLKRKETDRNFAIEYTLFVPQIRKPGFPIMCRKSCAVGKGTGPSLAPPNRDRAVWISVVRTSKEASSIRAAINASRANLRASALLKSAFCFSSAAVWAVVAFAWTAAPLRVSLALLDPGKVREPTAEYGRAAGNERLPVVNHLRQPRIIKGRHTPPFTFFIPDWDARSMSTSPMPFG